MFTTTTAIASSASRLRTPSLLAATLLAFLCGSYANAQEFNRADFEQILVPVAYTGPMEGAHGSLWDTELWIRNISGEPIIFGQGRPTCPICPGDGIQRLAPLTTLRLRYHASEASRSGILLYVEKARSKDVVLTVHAQDISRAQVDWGTELPVVREAQFSDGRAIELLNVAHEPSYRVSLRMYGMTPSTTHGEMRVLVFPIDSNVPVFDQTVTLTGLKFHVDPEFSWHPTYVDIHDLSSKLPAAAPAKLRIRIEPKNAGQYWAFATVTHNATQHVTVVSPQ